MNVALINASPKKTVSASAAFLDDLKYLFPVDHVIIKEFCIKKPSVTEADIMELQDFAVWVFAFPLYVDAVPSHLLSCLCQIEEAAIASEDIYVYAFVNCGFYEGYQACNALEIMENWCLRAGLQWGMGIGFGGGPALIGSKNMPMGTGLKKSLGKACAVLVDAVLSHEKKENIYTTVSISKFLYKLTSEMRWKKAIKENGGKIRDLKKRL